LPIITLSSSRQLIALLTLVHLLTLAIVYLLPMGFALRGGLIGLLAVSWLFYLLRDARLALKNSVTALKWLPDDTLEIQQANGSWQRAQLQAGGFVADYLTIVAYRLQGQRFNRYIVLLPDMLETEAFRALRVRLRWKKLPPAPAK
jgi:hypothetical protein